MGETGARVLVVDLDGTLLRSDMLYESFWSALGRDWRSPVLSALSLLKGRAALKQYLAEASAVEVTNLPYEPAVLDYIAKWRQDGGRAVLVTASDQQFADRIGGHLGIFDEVHGSDGTRNLKSAEKARFIEERFGPGSFAYMGDARADVPVWARAAQAITVNAPASLQREAERACSSTEHLVTRQPSWTPYAQALRPHQWLKNVLVFLPMLAAHQWTMETFLASALAFVSFCLVASSVYVLNDLLDLSADRAHPRKRNRPFASGSIGLAQGTAMAVGLIVLGIVVAAAISAKFLLVMLLYWVLTTAYSLNLKRRMVIDISVLAALYTARIIAGGAATGIELSMYLLAFSAFFFLSLAAVKRQAELIDSVARGKLTASGRGYHVDDLPIISMIAISAGYVSALVMALHVNSPEVARLYHRPEALWGVSAVLLYWITRTVMIAHRGWMHDDPVVFAAKDRISQICFLLILGFVIGGALL